MALHRCCSHHPSRRNDVMVTIENLEVQFDVEGEGDEAVFARLFEQHMRRYSRAEHGLRERERRIEAECRLGDQPMDGAS